MGYWYRCARQCRPGREKVTIAACIIAHNEEAELPATLSALEWVDELVVVDCGSSDGTAEIAEKSAARVFTRPNLSNLNVNKNYSFRQATSDWILCLDADEIVSEALAREIRARAVADSTEDGFFLKRKNSWFGRTLMHGGHFPDRQLRLFRRGRGAFPERHVHERLEVQGSVGTLDEPLEHYPYRSVSEYVRKMEFYTSFEAEQRIARGERFSAGGFLLELAGAKFRLLRRYLFRGGFLDGWQGFAAAYLDFLGRMVVQFKMRDLEGRRR